ncbi:MAG: hypothetical protein HYW78_02780 [Parcubacteria group bacterium]|nr:hypothetical protein [Parcubacteria group bacterium]
MIKELELDLVDFDSEDPTDEIFHCLSADEEIKKDCYVKKSDNKDIKSEFSLPVKSHKRWKKYDTRMTNKIVAQLDDDIESAMRVRIKLRTIRFKDKIAEIGSPQNNKN